MKRDTLTRYLRSLVMAAMAGCCSPRSGGFDKYVDRSTIQGDFDGGVPDAGSLALDVCRTLCATGSDVTGCSIEDGNPATVHCHTLTHECGLPPPGAGGPAPAGLRPMPRVLADDPVGEYFARMAYIEEAAVLGFAQLADELTQLGAPRALSTMARAASDDERRHARIARRLARDFGAQVPRVIVDETAPRSALAIALHNATEGGVDETFAAAVTLCQSLRARDLRVRAAFAVISRDELRHAELARAVAGWLEPRLTPTERAQVSQARRQAAERLTRSFSRAFDPRLVEIVGLPTPALSQRLISGMTRLWS